ncbi:MAG TPA: sigma-70 family RNA polymerase sigma factor [Chloroflexota bacterium]|nr:sigma-70 family RNA polymerase sigma factor [Chloroflexota bacterium]
MDDWPEKRLVHGSLPTTSEIVAIRPGDRAAAAAGTGWLQEYAATRDPALRERIILAYLGLADRLAMRYRHSRGTSLEDLTQTARTGLIAAVDRYDPAKNQSFVPYAVASVVGELKRHLRDTSWRLHMARPRKEHVLRLCRAGRRHARPQPGRAPGRPRAPGGAGGPPHPRQHGRGPARPGTPDHHHAVLRRAEAGRHRGQDRLLADARVAAAAPSPGPNARRAPGSLTMPTPFRRGDRT